MATPAYRGTGQPPLDSSGGFLGRLGSLLGASTPPYSGDGQPSSGVGVLGRASPVYMPAPTVQESAEDDFESAETQSSCPIDPTALAAGHIAIVIPRNSVMPDREVQQAETD